MNRYIKILGMCLAAIPFVLIFSVTYFISLINNGMDHLTDLLNKKEK